MEESKKWYDNKGIVALLCVLFFPVGLYALWKSRTISKGWKVGVTIVIGIFVVAALGEEDLSETTARSNSQNSTQTESQVESVPEKEYVETGDVLSTRYFDVTVNRATVQSSVDTGNQFTRLSAEPDILYVILNVTFKNTDNESRMIVEGDLLINYNGTEYKFDKTETIMSEGYGSYFDQINPLTSKTTNLVYKIPEEINGPAYYNPGRSSSNDLIFLGEVK